jgi:6-phosphogluconolactonase
MMWNNLGRGAKALAVSLALVLGVTACSRDYTVAYLYVTAATSTTAGLINAYAIDYQTGSLEALADSPIPSGGRNPVSLAVLHDGNGLFVVNHDDSTVVAFDIGTDGKLYASATYNISNVGGSFPTSVAVDSQDKFLFVTYTYQQGFTTASPGPGGVSVFAISEATNPTNVTLTSTSPTPYIFVLDQEGTSAVPTGVTHSFAENAGTGALTAVGTYNNGTIPAAIVVDPTSRFVYISDSGTNQIYSYLNNGGVLSQTSNNNITTTGQLPKGMVIDPRGTYLFVANYNSSTVNGFTINVNTGALTQTGTVTVATGPTCVTMENALGVYLFTSNYLDNSVSGEKMDPHSGSLTGIQGTQFSASKFPTCAAAIANGSHATALVTY